MTPSIRKPFTRQRSSIKNTGASLTQQSFAGETSINSIMAKYYQTGQMPLPRSSATPRYGDFSTGADYQTALNSVLKAKEDFSELPSSIRNRFHNDPGLLLEFLSNPRNEEEAIQLGLIAGDVHTPPANPSPAPVEPNKPEHVKVDE